MISVSNGMEMCMRSKAAMRHYVTITNGFDPQDIPAWVPPRTRRQGLLLAYFGTYTKFQHAPGLVRALARLVQRQDIVVRFTGQVDDYVVQAFDDAGLAQRLHVEPHRLYRDALSEMSSADILVVAAPRVKHLRGVLPVKMFEYLGVGRPILALSTTGRRAGCYLARV